MQVDGACHCGRITFTAEVDPGKVTICHYRDCQVLSGSPFRASVAAPMIWQRSKQQWLAEIPAIPGVDEQRPPRA